MDKTARGNLFAMRFAPFAIFISVYSYLQLFLFCDFDFAMRFAIELHGSQTRESREAENRPAWQISLRMAIDSTVS